MALALAPAYVSVGKLDRAKGIYEALITRRTRDEYVPPFVLSVCASALGDHEQALAFCEQAIESRDMLFALFHRWLPAFERVRTDSRFPDIVARFNARDSEASSR